MHTPNCILVTGGAGFIGANLVRHLLETAPAARIINLDALTYAGNPENLDDLPPAHADRHRFVQGDICDGPLVAELLEAESVDTIIHLAAESHVDRSIDGPAAFIETNVRGTFTLLEAARETWRDRTDVRFHHVSTDEVYGSLGEDGLFTETTPYDPSSPYSASKAASDHLVRAWHRTYNLPVTISNCSNNYGPYQFPEKLLPLMIIKALDRQPLPVYGDGTNVRDWLYVRDHCRAIDTIVRRGIPGQTYNVGGCNEWTNIDIVRLLCDTLESLRPSNLDDGYHSLISFVKDRPGHDKRYAIDASRIQNELGWQPAETFQSGLRKTIQWYLEHPRWTQTILSGGYRADRQGQVYSTEPKPETQAKRPNIVFAFGDDWGRYARAYAAVEGEDSLSAHIDTPNFDRVAKEGVLFTNAFVTAPSCTPARSSVLSGRYFWECGLGAILQGAVWDESIPTYPLLLEEAGYHIGYTYKVWSPGWPPDAPYGGDRTSYQTRSWMSNFSQTATSLIDECGGIEEAKKRVYEEVHESFDQFLEARPDDSPFCYWWGPTNTHRKWQQGSGKNLWGLNPEGLEGKLPAFLPDVPEVREDVCDYLGECMAFDAGLGIILDKLEAIGELDNTLVIVSGDHGIPGMPRGKCNLYDHGTEVALAARWPGRIPANRVVDDFVNLMDLAPTFLEAAGETPPECMSAQSLLPVLLGGKSGTVDPARDFVVTGRERHVAAAREGNLPYPQRSIRTSEYLYILNFEPDRWPMGDPQGLDDPATPAPSYEDLREDTLVAYPDLDASPTKAWMVHHRAEEAVAPLYEIGFGKRPSEELYDLRNDPDHMRNIVDDPACATVRDELHERLMCELRNHDDPRVAQSPCSFEHPPFTNK